MKQYSIHIPGWGYAMTAYGSSKRDAVARFRKQHAMLRMPKGYAIWETD
jgi:hypothetical protein